MAGEHIFAEFIRTLGRGPARSRPLTEAEAEAAMGMILAGQVEPIQLGAMLMLMRYRGEAPAEIAGFVRAVRAGAGVADDPGVAVDLDWPSYADRHRQIPWFVLSALLLAENGVRVLMHGVAGAREGYASTRDALLHLGIPASPTLAGAGARLESDRFAYVGVEDLAPQFAALFDLRPLLGLRSPVNTVGREFNPARAPWQMQGIFHPPYRSLHQGTALLLGQPHTAIFKGGGGEAQRNPDKSCHVVSVHDGVPSEEEWPALPEGAGFRPRDEILDTRRVAALWRGDIDEPGPVAAVTGTAALALKLLGRARDRDEAQGMAADLWCRRPRARYGAGLALSA